MAGRKMERTLTGNSIHYVLMPDGQVVDAIPGLYGPKAFLKQISRGEALVRLLADASAERRISMLADFHAQQAAEVTKAWQADWTKAMAALGTKSGSPNPEEMQRKLEAMLRAEEAVRQSDNAAQQVDHVLAVLRHCPGGRVIAALDLRAGDLAVLDQLQAA